MLSPRKETILKIIVGEYVNTATPVPSQSVARQHGLRVSPATVRNEMVELEEEGYISRPHISAGSMPSDRGYRYYVQSLAEESQLTEAERLAIKQRFFALRHELDDWAKLASDILSNMAQNMAVATLPKLGQPRLKRLELVSLQDFLVLLVLVLQETRIKRRILPLTEAVAQDELIAVSNKLSARFGGASRRDLARSEAEMTPLEKKVINTAHELLMAEEEEQLEDPIIDGVRYLLHQPEFEANRKTAVVLDALEDRRFVKELLLKILFGEEPRVIIGAENDADAMHECSIVLSRYGSPDMFGGIVGVIGPTRMKYERTIASVRYLSALMSELSGELTGDQPGSMS